MSSFTGLNTAVSGMYSNQKALEVTGHNISNLGTPGYTRQQAVLATANTQYIVNNWVEMGAKVEEVRQIRNAFLDNIYRREVNALGYWEARYNSVKDLEAILGEPMLDGLQNTLNQFWNSWQELAKTPDSLTVRALVRQRAEALVYHLNHMGHQINKLQDDINTEIIKRIDEVNSITTEIAELNILIAKAEIAGNRPNDYYDQRNYLVDQLSKLVKTEVREHADGQMDVIVGGYFLVSRTEKTNIVAAQNSTLSHFVTPEVEGLGVELDVGEGTIKGLLESRGMVSGAKGSYDNGTPNTTADITFAVNLSDASPEYLSNLKNSIKNYVSEIRSNGLNYNLRLITYDESGNVINANFGANYFAFLDAIDDLSTNSTSFDFGSVVSELANTEPFSDGANRYLVVYTPEGITASEDELNNFAKTLKANNMSVSVLAPPEAEGVPGWNTIANATGGEMYDITTAEEDFASLMSKIGMDTAANVNKRIATANESLNIISSVKKMLNAVVSIVAREVNRLHMSGKTLNGLDGGLFFEPIEDSMPIEMGNIKVSDSIKDLNNIVASATDANGDNELAIRIAKLRNESLMTSATQVLSVDAYYQHIILKVGNVGNEARQHTESQKALVHAADNDRQAIIGVSIDEEMSNMIKFKYAYNAATKTIGVINEMLDTIINRTGIAGR